MKSSLLDYFSKQSIHVLDFLQEHILVRSFILGIDFIFDII